jgi:hypothetical protein
MRSLRDPREASHRCIEGSSVLFCPGLREGDIVAMRKGTLLVGTGISLGVAVGPGPSGIVDLRKKHQMRAAEYARDRPAE